MSLRSLSISMSPIRVINARNSFAGGFESGIHPRRVDERDVVAVWVFRDQGRAVVGAQEYFTLLSRHPIKRIIDALTGAAAPRFVQLRVDK
jgi:hypothetical protein